MLSFFPVMTKTLKFFTALIALTLATPALAQGPGVPPPPMGGGDEVSTHAVDVFYVYLHWYRTNGILNSAPLTYADGTPLQAGDVIALLFVMPEEGVTFGADDDLPFSINADSSVTLKNGAKRAVWAGYMLASAKDKGGAIDPENPGYPKGGWFSTGLEASVGFLWPHEVEGVGTPETCAVYLVALGSRAWEWDAETQSYVSVSANTNPLPEGNASRCDLPSCVTKWSAVWCKNIIVTDRFTGGMYDITVNISEEAYKAMLAIENPNGSKPYAAYSNGVIVSVDKTPTLETAVVDGSELSGTDLEAALKPTISGMVATTITNEDGSEIPAFTFDFTPAPLPGLSTYTLYTATDLAGPWEPFDKVLDKVLEEKELANPSGMRYTTLRIDGEESVLMTIPRLENDPTRFYRLQGDVEVVTTGQEGE